MSDQFNADPSRQIQIRGTLSQPMRNSSRPPMWLLGCGGLFGLSVILVLVLAITTGPAIVNQLLTQIPTTRSANFNIETVIPPTVTPDPNRAAEIAAGLSNQREFHETQLVTAQNRQSSRLDVNINHRDLGLCNYGCLHTADGTIRAGVSLTGFDENDISYDAATNTYTITLLKPYLTDCNVDIVDQYQCTPVTFVCANVNYDELRRLAETVATRAMASSAVENSNLITTAGERAEQYFQAFVEGIAPGANVRVVYDDTRPQTNDASCSPPYPSGWRCNLSTGECGPS